MEKFFGVNYSDAGNFSAWKKESEIEQDDLSEVNEGNADIFKVEVTQRGEPMVRRAMVEEKEKSEDEAELVIADWELII